MFRSIVVSSAMAVVALGACGKSEEQPVAPAAKKSGLDLFATAVPAPPPPVDKLRPGMSHDEAKAAAPEVFATALYEVPGYDHVALSVLLDNRTKRVEDIVIELADSQDVVKAALSKKWGEPRVFVRGSIRHHVWDHPVTGVRASLEPRASASQIRFGDVLSIEQLLGSTPGQLGFETTPILGSTQQAVIDSYQTRNPEIDTEDPGAIVFRLPPLEVSELPVQVDVRIKSDKVTGYTLGVSTQGDSATPSKLHAGLETLFGKPGRDGADLVFPGPPSVRLHEDQGYFYVRVGDYQK